MTIDPDSGYKARDFMFRLHVLNTISKRTLMNLCFGTECTLQVCRLNPHTASTTIAWTPKKHVALTTFDLDKNDVKDIVILKAPKQVKLVSTLAVKNVHVEGSSFPHPDQSIEQRISNSRSKDSAMISAMRPSWKLIFKLAKRGPSKFTKLALPNTMPPRPSVKNNKEIPKARPTIPAILKQSCTLSDYPELAIVPTNFLTIEFGNTVVARVLEICAIKSELRSNLCLILVRCGRRRYRRMSTWRTMPMPSMAPGLGGNGLCDACLNNEAIGDRKKVQDELWLEPRITPKLDSFLLPFFLITSDSPLSLTSVLILLA
ncbi:hypothetical protein B0H13DRAFT_2368940 [Mycena leptocephala]|nr:hypothetical protein B0H13DRAFT_2368940 [Mycena leptocephala]